MKIVVQKFGGTSVGSISRIRHVAKVITETIKNGEAPIVVVSAMAGQTNKLIDLGQQITQKPALNAYDMLVASGEQVSSALLSMALEEEGLSAQPLLGFQVGMQTSSSHSKARIENVNTDLLERLCEQKIVPVVAGFQGSYLDKTENIARITTLGRGGSDTSAVAIAAALKAKRCDIFTDVDGIYTADPRICSEAKKINSLTFAEMMEMASLGAKVLHMRSVELAAKYKVPLYVKSTFDFKKEGTLVTGEENMLESPVVSSITSSKNESLINIALDKEQAQFPAKIFENLATAEVNVDIITRIPNAGSNETISLSVPRSELKTALEKLKDFQPTTSLENAAKVSIVGIGMKSYSGVAAKMFRSLETAGIPISLITTSEIKVSVVIPEEKHDQAIAQLHKDFFES